MTIGAQEWAVVSAVPPRRADFGKTGTLLLNLTPLGIASPHDILFTLPTVSSEFPPIATRVARDRGAVLTMQEDDWRQVELVSTALESIVDTEFEAIREVLEHQRVDQGYQHCHARRLIPEPIQRHVRPERIRALLSEGRPLAEGAGIPRPMATELISDTFAVELASLAVYGHELDGRVDVLGLKTRMDPVGDRTADDRIISEVMIECNAMIVDWCGLRKVTAEIEAVRQFLEA
jgi:hypothetical protein